MVVIRVLSIIAVIFGFMTVISGSAVLFSNGAVQKSAGNYVGFVVWFNLLTGFGYIIAGYGVWKLRKWSVTLSFAITVGILLVFLALCVHVKQGELYEMRTFYALTFRMLLWLTISIVSYRKIARQS